MRLYLDDDSTSALLVRLFRQAGHDVRIRAEIGMASENAVQEPSASFWPPESS